MKLDQTVCHFCGVSYLIHNTVKQLETELEEARGQIAALKVRECPHLSLLHSSFCAQLLVPVCLTSILSLTLSLLWLLQLGCP